MPFTASIIERNFAYVPDKILKLGGAAWLRPFSTCAAWGRIRLGVLCSVPANGTANITDTLFLLGMCHGQTAPGSAYSTDNFIGASMIGAITPSATRTLTYTAGSGNPYYSCTAGVGFHKNNAAIVETSAAFSSPLLLPLTNTGFYSRRALVILDILRNKGGSGGVTFAVYYSTTAATIQGSDFRPDHLFEALDQPGVPSVRGGTFASVLSSTAVGYSPIGGDVDTFEIFWSNVTFPLEISALGATVWNTLDYSDSTLGTADDTFESYALGTVTTQVSAGSGWNSALYVTPNGDGFGPQTYGQYVGTTSSPDETFEQYAVGTVDSGTTIYLGTYWTGAGVVYPISANVRPQIYAELAGTNLGDSDTFESYGTNDQANPYTTVFGGGSYWSAGTVYSYGSFSFVGTVAPNLAPLTGIQTLAGTAYSAFDTFESYGTGAVVSGVTINAGSYFSAAASIY